MPADGLAPPERFCFEMARLPRRPMLHAFRLQQSLPPSRSRAPAQRSRCVRGGTRADRFEALRLVLRSLLKHGNFLNMGTARAGARGIKLESLEKARTLKSLDGKTTLLEHACLATGMYRPRLRIELGHVPKACKVPLLDVLRIIKDVDDGIAVIEQELASPSADLEAGVGRAAQPGRAQPDLTPALGPDHGATGHDGGGDDSCGCAALPRFHGALPCRGASGLDSSPT